MSKCLVTRLKATVDNPNLKKFGEMVVKITTLESGSDAYFLIRSTEEQVVLFNDGTTTTPHTCAKNVGVEVKLDPNKVYTISIPNKYAVAYISAPSQLQFYPSEFYLEDLTYSSFEGINFGGTMFDNGIIGDIKSFSSFTDKPLHPFVLVGKGITGELKTIKDLKLDSITLFRTGVTGTIADIPLNVTSFSFNGSKGITGDIMDINHFCTNIGIEDLNVTGELCDYVKKWIDAGKISSGTITVRGSNMATYNGHRTGALNYKFTIDSATSFTATQNGPANYGGNLTATKSGGVWNIVETPQS